MINPLIQIPRDQILPYRRSGNTKRLVDFIIQILHTYPNQPVLIIDHYMEGEMELANKHLRDKLHNRINAEHREKDFVFAKLGSEARQYFGKYTVTYNPK